jgi:alkylation response protein AidB-like acyl-CoA dehydrogenase
MDLSLTKEQQELQNGAIEFARSELNEDVIRRDREEIFSFEGWKKCADFGVLGLPVPAQYGGLDLGITEVIAVMEGLGYGSRDQGLLFSMNAHLWTCSLPILVYGTEEQRCRCLPKLSNGECIGANAASEPDAGSDVFSMRTVAERHGNCYVLNGVKTFVSNAPVANLFAVYATLDPKLGPMGITVFLIDRDTPGLTVSKPLEKMGLRTSPWPRLSSRTVRFRCAIDSAAKAAAWPSLKPQWNGSAAAFSPIIWERCAGNWKNARNMSAIGVSSANRSASFSRSPTGSWT